MFACCTECKLKHLNTEIGRGGCKQVLLSEQNKQPLKGNEGHVVTFEPSLPSTQLAHPWQF